MIKKIHEDVVTENQNEMIKLPSKPPAGFYLTRNLALAGLLLLSITSIRNASLPSGNTILTSVQNIIDADWDSDLGKISFVSNLFPETVSVFFESSPDVPLIQPCFGQLIHAWSKQEPYLGYQSLDHKVYAVASGEIMSIAHGIGEEIILRVRQADGMETLYYNLKNVSVQEGDQVTVSTVLGEVSAADQAVIEVRKNGLTIDPTQMMEYRGETSL